MGIMHKATATSGLTNTANTAETVMYTTPTLTIGQGDGAVGVSGTLNFTGGTSATALTIRIRQGSLTGTLVGGAPVHTIAAGAPQSISFGGTDSSPYLEGGGVYVITGQQTAGAAAGVPNLLDIEVIV
jgi:hypothetical protein